MASVPMPPRGVKLLDVNGNLSRAWDEFFRDVDVKKEIVEELVADTSEGWDAIPDNRRDVEAVANNLELTTLVHGLRREIEALTARLEMLEGATPLVGLSGKVEDAQRMAVLF